MFVANKFASLQDLYYLVAYHNIPQGSTDLSYNVCVKFLVVLFSAAKCSWFQVDPPLHVNLVYD